MIKFFSDFFLNFRLRKHEKKQVYFYRNFRAFCGGHLKVWHYFSHLRSSPKYQPNIYFAEGSSFDDTNPWKNTTRLEEWSPSKADIIFIAGPDWRVLLNDPKFLELRGEIPVINLIQGVSHADPSSIKYPFLAEKAIRICVSAEVSNAILNTGIVNGPVFTIPNGIDLTELPRPLPLDQKNIDLLIMAIKNPELGNTLQKGFEPKLENIIAITQQIPRNDFLNLLNRAKVAVFLPYSEEGFYLPALEGMALNALVVCPDCVGNRSFCIDGETCFSPRYENDSIFSAVNHALSLTSDLHKSIIQKARNKLTDHNIESEKRQFLNIMSQIKELWQT